MHDSPLTTVFEEGPQTSPFYYDAETLSAMSALSRLHRKAALEMIDEMLLT